MDCPHCTSGNVRLYGQHRNGHQRYRCAECGKTFSLTSLVDKDGIFAGMFSPKEKLSRMVELFRQGHSLRHVAAVVGVAKQTANTLRKRLGYIQCPCGRESRHRGWCRWRYEQHPYRQYIFQGANRELLERFTELWHAMPAQEQQIALVMCGDSIFKELSDRTKMHLLECGWSWVQLYLTQEQNKSIEDKEKQCLKDAQSKLAAVRRLLKQSHPWRSPREGSPPDKTSPTL